MGNRIQGFLAGVALTGFLTVTTSAAIKRHERINTTYIRAADEIITERILLDRYEKNAAIPVNKRVFYQTRPLVWETCKDIWNDEIIKMTNRVYSINWYQWGLNIERKLHRLADKAGEVVAEKK